MDTELDHDLDLKQWNILKALRLPSHQRRRVDQMHFATLVQLGLARWHSESAIITPMGRKVLVRGSVKLLDLAA